ncbi:MAG: tetratricopeptide repeat protein [Vicinamibacterales bacterium]
MIARRWRAAALLAAVLAWPALAGAQVPAGAPVLVLPFENPAQDPRLAWLREGAAVLLTDLLAAGGELVVERDERLRAYDRLQLPVTAGLSRALSIKVGQAVAAGAVVVGTLELSGDQLIVRGRVVRLDTGRLLPELQASGAPADLFVVFSRLAFLVSGSSGAPPAPTDRLPPSPQVFELYIRGLLAETPAAAIPLLQQALKAAPQFDAARLAMWDLHTEASEHQRALDALAGVRAESRVARDSRFMRALSLISLRRFDEALKTLRALQDEARSAAVTNAIGVVELRRTATPQPGRATYYFSQASEIDPADGDLFFNLGYAYWLDRDPRATIYWLREAVRRNPGDGDAHFILGVALQQTGAVAEAARERELAERLSSKYAGWEARAAAGDPVPRGLERLADELAPAARRVDTLLTSAGQRDQDALAAFHLDAGRRAFQREADREATQELRRALFLSPYLAEAHLMLGRLHLRGGRADEAVEALKIALWSDETVAAHVALAEAFLQAQDTAAARAEIDRALSLDPRSADALALKARIGGGPC